MASRKLLISIFALIALASCARTEDDAPAAGGTVRTMEFAQPGISIAQDQFSLPRGIVMGAISPLNTGGRIKNCVISPALPAGLVLDAKYCVISGTPSARQDETVYNVVADNQYGTSSIDLKITVTQGVLEGLLELAFNTFGYTSSENAGLMPEHAALIPQAEGKTLIAYGLAVGHKWLRFNADGTKNADPLNMLGAGCLSILGEACELGAATGLASGKLIVSYVGATYNQTRIVRYAADGTKDHTFGTAGVASLASPSTTAVPSRIRELANGKIVILVHLVSTSASAGWAPAVIRLNANGSFDNGFGSGGVAFVSGLHHADSMDVDTSSGKVYVGGALGALPADEAFVILADNGTVATAAATIATNSTEAHDLVFDSSLKKLIVLLNSAAGETRLLRFGADGAVDATFGSGGSVTRVQGGDYVARRVRLDRWGKIFVLGNQDFATSSRLRVDAFNQDGSVLGSFGTSGAMVGADPAAHLMTSAEFNSAGQLVVGGLATNNVAIAVLK